jgi:hypothetical protein
MTPWIVFLAAFMGSFTGIIAAYFAFGIVGSRKPSQETPPPSFDPKVRSVQFLEQFERSHPYPVDENGQIDPDAIERSMPPGLTD